MFTRNKAFVHKWQSLCCLLKKHSILLEKTKIHFHSKSISAGEALQKQSLAPIASLQLDAHRFSRPLKKETLAS
ncbi:hypothetical protein JCM10003_896 [Bacteroides pyogenes JCM 10003]|nr:hypothetical protein JCM10003_896 [Bacteroides pyogenes JCM 10003]